MIYMMIAGEASGDMHAAQLMKAIRRYDAKAQFVFFGGDNMAEAAGREPVVHIREMAYMGFSEVVRNLGKIRHNLRRLPISRKRIMSCSSVRLLAHDTILTKSIFSNG